MKMRPGTWAGILECGKEWTDGKEMEVRSS
jgi:hypothetical protein